MEIPVVKQVMSANEAVADDNHAIFARHHIFAVNVMASPGAGKTSTILATSARLPNTLKPGVIEGDLASSIDADKIAAQGIPVVQINTGGGCHLDAPMIQRALPTLPLDDIRLLFVENVGNLICPSNFELGTDLALVVASVSEGFDKPHKYPSMFARADVVVLNKADLMAVFEFDMDFFTNGVRMVNQDAPIFVISCKTGLGLDDWVNWLVDRVS